jgi:glycosyltransferase involved in cell wall biosynthesis
MIKHSILMITYNQEKYIGHAIESIINQSEQAYELIVLDDCSKDNTFEVVKKYSEKHKFIKVFRNDFNIGISQNIRKINSLVSGNVISHCAGDDYFELDCIKNINETFRENRINPTEESTLVITNSAHHHEPTGKITHWNNYKEKNISLIKSRLRYSLSFRSVGYSIKLYKSMSDELTFKEKYEDLGLWYDYLVGFEEVLKVKKYFFIDKIGAYYRVNVGVTSVERDKNYWNSYKNVFKVLKFDYDIHFDKSDLCYINFKISLCNYKLKPNIINFYKSFKLLILNKNNFAVNNSFTKNLTIFLPDHILSFIKKYVYPYLLKIFTKKIWIRL